MSPRALRKALSSVGWFCALLTVSVVVIMIASVWCAVVVYDRTLPRTAVVWGGGLSFTWDTPEYPTYLPGRGRLKVDVTWAGDQPSFSGFIPRVRLVTMGQNEVMIPLYLFAGITSLAWWATRLFSRPKPGACPDCGYNLTGLAQEMVCPECGFNPELNVRKAARQELE
jgi:hypothetical protein